MDFSARPKYDSTLTQLILLGDFVFIPMTDRLICELIFVVLKLKNQNLLLPHRPRHYGVALKIGEGDVGCSEAQMLMGGHGILDVVARFSFSSLPSSSPASSHTLTPHIRHTCHPPHILRSTQVHHSSPFL